MFKRILVSLDGSSFAERALPHAEKIARMFGSKIILLRVLETTGEINQPQAVDPLIWQIKKNQAEEYLKETANSVKKRISNKGADVEYDLLQGKPSENIITFAHNENIDLLVMCTHGWGGFSRWNLSSVTQKIINRIYLPVLLIRAYEESEAAETNISYRRILMPVDSSPRSECAFSAGIRFINGENEAAKTINAESKKEQVEPHLFLTTVIRPPEIPVPEPHAEDIRALVDQFMQVSKDAAQQYLNRIKSQLSVPSKIKIIEHHIISQALQRVVEEENIDLIIMCAHGYTGHYNYPYGSVAREMLEFGAKPILIIQDIPLCQVRSSDSEIAAQKTGSAIDDR
ncbi:MAG TPA: universal stress protein [Treponemataceae bacterium]|nr:universal stress protein [Treponemataceae bacterium]